MGEPQKGQIVDNIFLSVQQVKLGGSEVGSKGDLLVRKANQTDVWVKAEAAEITANLQRQGGAVQARADFDTTGLADGAVVLEVLAAPSYIYATVDGSSTNVGPGDRVKLAAAGQSFIQALAADITNGDVMGRFSRLAGDQAGNNEATTATAIGIIELGVGV